MFKYNYTRSPNIQSYNMRGWEFNFSELQFLTTTLMGSDHFRWLYNHIAISIQFFFLSGDLPLHAAYSVDILLSSLSSPAVSAV